MRRALVATVFVAVMLNAVAASAAAGQAGRPPSTAPPGGQTIEARDGDVVTVRNGARVRIVQRRDAHVRVIHNGAQQWLVMLVDYVPADGRVDASYSYNDISGHWPLGERWEGTAVLLDYSVVGQGGSAALGIVVPHGLLQLVSLPVGAQFHDAGAAAILSYRRAGRSGGGASFDDVEARQVEMAVRNVDRSGQRLSTSDGSVRMELNAGVAGGEPGGAAPRASGETPAVRVGGSVRRPAQLVDVKPVMPETARNAGISGTVILEVTIGIDGQVEEARVLRSIPLLDAAAVEAARQWRFEPTLLNGKPVPLIMTVAVAF